MTAQKWSGPADASPICAGVLEKATEFALAGSRPCGQVRPVVGHHLLQYGRSNLAARNRKMEGFAAPYFRKYYLFQLLRRMIKSTTAPALAAPLLQQ
jgi:hypothetical protein